MKVYFRILCLSLIVFGRTAIAQYMSVPMTINTPYGPVHSSYMVPTPYNYNYGNGNSNPKYTFEVTLKSDSVVKVRSRILAENKKFYLLHKDKKAKRKIFPDQTKGISNNSMLYGVMKGFPADSCWLFKVTTGAINCYTSVPIFDINYAMAIQKGEGGQIVGLTAENLRAITGTEDEKIAKWLKKNHLVKVIEYYNEKARANSFKK